LPAVSTYQELLRVLVDRQSGEIVVEVEGQQYTAISQVKERAIGQRILEVISLLLKFSGGVAATTAGFKTLPIPPARLTSLPPEPPATLKPTATPEPAASEINLAERLGAAQSDQPGARGQEAPLGSYSRSAGRSAAPAASIPLQERPAEDRRGFFQPAGKAG
jgi:hypothetical protein